MCEAGLCPTRLSVRCEINLVPEDLPPLLHTVQQPVRLEGIQDVEHDNRFGDAPARTYGNHKALVCVLMPRASKGSCHRNMPEIGGQVFLLLAKWCVREEDHSACCKRRN